MNIDEAARATRKYYVDRDLFQTRPCVGGNCHPYNTVEEAQAACDRINLLAVLEAIREPTQAMIDAAPRSDLRTLHGAVYVWRAMIAALIAEAKNGRS